ncbi:MAG: hypothetical protein RL757_2835 [Bacteroidota bacterium]|jgi:hypothetical protein
MKRYFLFIVGLCSFLGCFPRNYDKFISKKILYKQSKHPYVSPDGLKYCRDKALKFVDIPTADSVWVVEIAVDYNSSTLQGLIWSNKRDTVIHFNYEYDSAYTEKIAYKDFQHYIRIPAETANYDSIDKTVRLGGTQGFITLISNREKVETVFFRDLPWEPLH